MHSQQRKGDFLTWFLLAVVLGLGLTIALQARALRADDSAPRTLPDTSQAPAQGAVLGSAATQASRTPPWRNDSPSAS